MKTRTLAIAALLVSFVSACGSSSGDAATGGAGGEAATSGAMHGSSTTHGPEGASTGSTSSANTSTTTSTTSAGGANAGGASAGGASSSGGGGASGWTLVWSDEFDGPDGSSVDLTKWSPQRGGDGWGNQEREYYTSDIANAVQQGGNLVITAATAGASGQTCWYGQCQYTSARLQTLGLFEQAYGRIEARIQIPRGQGMWPAFWMLGNDISGVGWPACGEIDIMENIGREPDTVHGSMHGPGYSAGNAPTASFALPNGASFADDFHLFAIEWEPDVVRFYVDDTLYETQTSSDLPAGTTWVFDHPFFLLLNVAVGGSWPGDPDATTVFPQTMLVDYVRVYM